MLWYVSRALVLRSIIIDIIKSIQNYLQYFIHSTSLRRQFSRISIHRSGVKFVLMEFQNVATTTTTTMAAVFKMICDEMEWNLTFCFFEHYCAYVLHAIHSTHCNQESKAKRANAIYALSILNKLLTIIICVLFLLVFVSFSISIIR